nr:MAG TPA: lipocalin-like protein [Herelleviridae sp.]
MGEIATWSAVKTKVGLGKDSNECPTKAELLALSPTGTGENYVGLEISNASSYGNNETVQLSDIHKVTYKYTFTVDRTTLSFPASGGAPSPNRGFGLVSRKQKYVDGVISGSSTEVYYTQTAYPDWVSYNQTVPQYEAKANTGLVERSANKTFTQNESGKQITVQFTQAAATSTWAYTFTLTKASSNSIGALGGKVTFEIDSYKQEIRNGHNYGSQIPVSYKRTDDPDSSEILEMTIPENKTESSRGFNYIWTQDESNKKQNYTVTQAAGVKTYGTPTVYLGNIADIPASGGTAATPTYTYSQLWGWNGKTNDGGTISSGASVVWSENISGSNLGTTAKARTKLGSRTLTVTLNGKSGNASIDIYQAENKITNVTQGTWVVSISANPSTFTEQGGTSQISASARAPRTNHWSSGATSAASDAIGTPTLSIPTASTGFSLSGTTLTVAENKTANQRSVVVRATMDTVYKEVTVTQSAYLVEWRYTLTTSTPTLNFDALGTTKSGTISSYREKYINGSLVEGSHEGVNIQVKSTSAEIQSATAAVAITLKENTTTQARTGTVVYEQVGSGKTVTITCNQAAGTVSTRSVLEVIDNFGDSPAVGGSIFGIVKSGYYDVINGKDSTWHNVTPTLKSKSSYITNVEITKASGDDYNIGITLSENTSESSRRASLILTYGSKELDMATTQAGASVAWSYELKVNNGTQDLNQQVPAKPSGTYSFTISSKRYKIVNGSVTSQSEDTTWTTSIPGSPSWIHVEEQSNTLIVTVDENTTTSQRSADIVIFQTGSSDTSITLTVEQQAASITTRDYINYVEPIPDGMFSALAQSITVTLQSYRETLINGKVTSKVAVQPDFDLDSTVTDWASVDLIGGNPTNYEYDFEVSVKENTTNQTRSGSVMFYNGAAEVENAWAFTQDAATISTRYEISWTANYSNGTVEENVTEVELEGTTGMENSVRMDLHILEYTSINGVEGTPTSWDSRTIAENNSAIASPSGQVSATLRSDSENAFIGITNSVQNLAEYPRTHTITLYNPKVVIKGKEVGTVPTITLLVNPIPYTRVFEFGWKQEGSTITNITLEGDIYGSSAGSRDIISYVSLRRNNVEFTKKYVKPTFIPPSEDWLQVIDNGQNPDNSYNWAFRALTNNEGNSARNLQVRFEQPGNGNQALYAYVSQDPRDEGYLGGRVNNNGPRTIRLNTIKDENWVGNTDIRSGNYHELGTLAQDAITIETNISVGGTDSSTYTQQVELSNLKFSKSGRPVTISNDPNQTTDYEYHWELYPSAGVPASFTVNISMLSSDGDNDNGIRLDIIKKNTAVFPIGSRIGTLTLTPKDPTKLPIITCGVSHRYFT